jgi:hypothetical protein
VVGWLPGNRSAVERPLPFTISRGNMLTSKQNGMRFQSPEAAYPKFLQVFAPSCACMHQYGARLFQNGSIVVRRS